LDGFEAESFTAASPFLGFCHSARVGTSCLVCRTRAVR
jgi:hypothetical protein